MSFLYTFFFEYQGGTYIDQVTAVDENEAMQKWAVQLPHEEIQGLGRKTKQLLIEKIKEEKAVAICGVTNV